MSSPRYRLRGFSAATKLLVAGILLLSVLGRSVLQLLAETFGTEVVRASVKLAIGLVALYALSGLSLKRNCLKAVGILLTLGCLAAFVLRLPEERVHLLVFAVLGASLLSDLRTSKSPLFYAILLGITIGIIDELFQAALPWRVGDARDAFINAIGVVWGVLAQKIASQPNVANPQVLE